MRKIIALLSLALMSGCMYALAEDSSMSQGAQNTQNSANDTMNQAGTAANDMGNSASDTSQTTTDTMKKQTTTTAKNAAKTCIDENGNTLKKGDVGFRSCLKKQMNKQESGTAGSDTTTHMEERNTNTNQNSG